MKNIRKIFLCAVLSLLFVPLAMAESEISEAWQLFTDGEYAKAKAAGQHLLELSIENKDVDLQYQSLGLLNAVAFTRNEYSDEVLERELLQEKLAFQLNDAARIAGISNNLAYDLMVTGKAPLGEIIERMKLANSYYAKEEKTQGRWYTLMNLTWAYRLAGDSEKSLAYGKLAIAEAEKINDRHAIIETNIVQAENYLLESQEGLAEPLFDAAKTSAGDNVDRDFYVFGVYYAKLLISQGKLDDAQTIANASLAGLTDVEVFYASLAMLRIAEINLLKENFEEAIEHAQKIVDMRGNFVSREAYVSAVNILRKIYKRNFRIKEARSLHESAYEHLKVIDSPFLNRNLNEQRI